MVKLLTSKWLKAQVLLDSSELRTLFDSLGEFYLVKAGQVVGAHESDEISIPQFLRHYQDVIENLKQGLPPEEHLFHHIFTSAISYSKDILYYDDLPDGRHIIRYNSPVIQLQVLRLGYSREDHILRSMVYGPDTIWWGIQFSYPQICVDSKTDLSFDLSNTVAYPNTQLFRQIQREIRKPSVPAPFIIQGKLQNQPVRLGNKCFAWIDLHPQLKELNLKVDTTKAIHEN